MCVEFLQRGSDGESDDVASEGSERVMLDSFGRGRKTASRIMISLLVEGEVGHAWDLFRYCMQREASSAFGDGHGGSWWRNEEGRQRLVELCGEGE